MRNPAPTRRWDLGYGGGAVDALRNGVVIIVGDQPRLSRTSLKRLNFELDFYGTVTLTVREGDGMRG